jgi:poly-gamma-glutamate synthase PgsB/CapB
MLTHYSIFAVSILLLIFIVFYWRERYQHEKRLRSIPLRVWINGSRGKSSVTRLIAAGLRANGMQVIAKTTGTTPRFIINNSVEEPIARLGMANIREQVTIVKRALDFHAQALVFECMALRPDLQRIEARDIVKPTIVVITNIRPDHLDVMGPTLDDIRNAYSNALPDTCAVFTTDESLARRCAKRPGITCTYIVPGHVRVHTAAVAKKLDYIEHAENIALALAVCQHCGIETKDATDTMATVTPDPGALRSYSLTFDNKNFDLVYAMAANDPESTRMIWDTLEKKTYEHMYVLINCRQDRLDRSLQFALMARNVFKDVTGFILTGQATNVLYSRIIRSIDEKRILDIGNKTAMKACRIIAEHIPDKSLIFAMGNTVGYGMELISAMIEKGCPSC